MPAEDPLGTLTKLAKELNGRLDFESTLTTVVNCASELLGVSRVSLRLLDPTRTELIATTRAGQPLHLEPQPFRVGQGLLGWVVEHGTPLRLADAAKDSRFEVRPGMQAQLASFLGVPLFAGQQVTGVLSAVTEAGDFFDERDEQLAVLLAAIVAPWVEVARLSRLTTVDPLTGALNRRGLDAAFPELETPRAPISVVMADLDHFKQVNDRHGHAAGDEVLRAVGSLFAGLLRAGDAVVRYGGEEFLIALPGAPLSAAIRVAERARIGLARGPLGDTTLGIRVTASFGVAERAPGELRESVIARADEALYRAKRAGRDRVCAARELPDD